MHDSKYIERKKELLGVLNTKISNVSDTANTAVQTARNSVDKSSYATKDEQMRNNIQQIQQDVMNLKQTVGGIKHTMNSLEDDNTRFVPVVSKSPPASPQMLNNPSNDTHVNPWDNGQNSPGAVPKPNNINSSSSNDNDNKDNMNNIDKNNID